MEWPLEGTLVSQYSEYMSTCFRKLFMESVLIKANLVILSTGQYWLIFNGEKGMSDREGHGHKAVVYKSHFPPLRHSVVTETPADTLANKPRLTKDQALCSLCPHDNFQQFFKRAA